MRFVPQLRDLVQFLEDIYADGRATVSPSRVKLLPINGRERQIAELLYEGIEVEALSGVMRLHPTYLRFHCASLCTKLGVNVISDAVRLLRP